MKLILITCIFHFQVRDALQPVTDCSAKRGGAHEVGAVRGSLHRGCPLPNQPHRCV